MPSLAAADGGPVGTDTLAGLASLGQAWHEQHGQLWFH